jgi:hypothetical protein
MFTLFRVLQSGVYSLRDQDIKVVGNTYVLGSLGRKPQLVKGYRVLLQLGLKVGNNDVYWGVEEIPETFSTFEEADEMRTLLIAMRKGL